MMLIGSETDKVQAWHTWKVTLRSFSYILPSFTDIDDIESDIPDTHEDKRSPCGQESNENQLLLNESQSKAKVNSYTSDSLFKDFRV